MAENLPDEILSEILSPALKVPEHRFSDTSSTSPFATYSGSSSAALLVSKAWLRVSTPLLYTVVILRSKAQAGALASALQGDQKLGRFIKKLRVEGGFGASMHQILKATPNVTDIFISTTIHSPDTTSGLVLGLPLINPTRLILFEDCGRLLKNKWVVQLFASLVAGINVNWTNLTTVVLSHASFDGPARKQFEDALCSSRSVKIVSVDVSSVGFLNRIAKIPSLEAIEMRATPRATGTRYFDAVAAQPELKRLVKWAPDPEVQIWAPIEVLPTNPTFCPMSSEPQSVVEAVWTRVLFFAMIADDAMKTPPLNANVDLGRLDEHFESQKINRRRLVYLLVSKMFHRLALPYLYRYTVIWNDRTAERLGAHLAANLSLGLHVHEIHRRDPVMLSAGEDEEQHVPVFAPLLSRTPRLRRFTADRAVSALRWDAFAVLAETAGETLVEMAGLYIECMTSVPSQPTVFLHFTALRSLEWKSPAIFTGQSSSETQGGPFASALPALELLNVASPGIFPALEQFALPSLRRLVLGTDVSSSDCTVFLRRHGPKLISLQLTTAAMGGSPSVFELCPSIRLLKLNLVGTEQPNEAYPLPLVFPPTHRDLRQVVVVKHPTKTHVKNGDEEEWGRFLDGSAWADFPALREIRAAPFTWPTDERAISRSPWVKWAEGLLEKEIKLMDQQGKHWTPRFKRTRR
ncbi:hypothetical protein FB451DRAFT_1100173 [Mycena latifolia]|nr:hypothetical protein FB451DRAFT_1100173 [Mycena latifolia]